MRVIDSVAASVGQRVLTEMADQHIRQTAVARRLGLSQGAISRRLRGEVPFDVAELAVIARFLDLPLIDLIPQPLDIAA